MSTAIEPWGGKNVVWKKRCLIAGSTADFLFVIIGATGSRAPAGFAPIAIGLALTLIH